MREDLAGKMIRLRSAIGAWRRTAHSLRSTGAAGEGAVALFEDVRRQYEAGAQNTLEELRELDEENPEEARACATALTAPTWS